MKKLDLDNDKKIDTGFKIPENYFDSFEDRLMQRIFFEVKNEKIDTGFIIPEDYFKSFEDKIMQKVLTTNNETKVISLWRHKSVWISSVAAAIVISLGTFLYFNNTNSSINLDSQEYLAYSSDLTTEDIVNHLTDEDIDALENELAQVDSNAAETYINEYLN